MKRIISLIFLSILILANGCTPKSKKDRTISISGAFALYPLVVQWADVYQKEHPGIRFNISAGGAGKGMADALSGTTDLGMFSREIAEQEKSQGVWWVGLSIDAVLPTISDKNPFMDAILTKGLNREQFREIFIDGSFSSWSELYGGIEAIPMNVYTRSDACGAAGTWARYLGGTQEDLKGIGIYGDPGLADAVAKDQGGIGFNNTIFVYDIRSGKKHDGLEIIPIDLDSNGLISPDENFYSSFDEILTAIAKKIYPSPPSRELYFVSKGKPRKKAVVDFIRWTLTDGQAYVRLAGYVPLDENEIQFYLEKLEQK